MSHPQRYSPELMGIAEIRKGDVAAFETVFRMHYRRLCAVVYGFVESAETAEEIVQELFLKIWRQRESLQIRESLQAYLYQAARNASLNHLKHRRIESQWSERVRGDNPPIAPAADDDLAENELSTAIQRGIAALPERCRLVFTMSRRQGLSYAEIADALGISVKTVEAHMGRALKSLRDRLDLAT